VDYTTRRSEIRQNRRTLVIGRTDRRIDIADGLGG
jgi:hypothetical protein